MIKFLIFICIVILYNSFTYEGEKSISLLTEYAESYNKDFMINNENCSENLNELSLALNLVVRKHKKNHEYQRDIILTFLKQYNCQFFKYGQSYHLEENFLFGSELENSFVDILLKYNYDIEFVTTYDAYKIIGKIKGLKNDRLIKKELGITYKLYEQRGMKIEKY